MPRVRPQTKRINILVADKEAVFRFGLMKLLGLEDDLRVVAQAEDGRRLLPLVKTFHPDVLLVAGEILKAAPSNLIAQIGRAWTRCKSVVMLDGVSEDESMQYVKTGASGVILKSADPTLYVKCVRRVMDGELWLPRQQVVKMAKTADPPLPSARRPADTLTPREKLVVSYLMAGCRNREVAQTLSISEQTVKNHLRAIYDKLGVSDRLELVLYAIHQRLSLPPVGDGAVMPAATPEH
jgi:two-component system nitrate/nitrite response regulator NarL